MNGKTVLLLIVLLAVIFSANVPNFAGEGMFGIELKTGMNQLDGDWQNPKLNPQGSFSLFYNPVPYLSIGGEFGYSELRTKDLIHGTTPSVIYASLYKTTVMPIEANVRFNLFPLAKVNPFVTIGGGGLWWNASYNGKTLTRLDDNQRQKGMDAILKAGGGLEFRTSQNLTISFSAAFRYSFTDMLDQKYSGDEKDAIASASLGLTYYIHPKSKDDIDNDGIPNALDLAPTRKENRNGFLDNDGKPDKLPALDKIIHSDKASGEKKDEFSPVVVHYPITEVEENRPIKIVAYVYEDQALRIATVLYRTVGTKDWNALRLKRKGVNKFEATIPARDVTPAGIEYCVLAVDHAVKGVGRSGWPKRPIHVKVRKNASTWRILGGTIATLGWGIATYVMLRKQNID